MANGILYREDDVMPSDLPKVNYEKLVKAEVISPINLPEDEPQSPKEISATDPSDFALRPTDNFINKMLASRPQEQPTKRRSRRKKVKEIKSILTLSS